jgi:hypothetical protein
MVLKGGGIEDIPVFKGDDRFITVLGKARIPG